MLPIIAGFTDYPPTSGTSRTTQPAAARTCVSTSSFAGEANLEVVDANEGRVPARSRAAVSTEVAATIVPNTVTKLICNATPDTIREFLSDLGTGTTPAATMARKIATLRSFYKWTLRGGLDLVEPDDGDPHAARQASCLPKAISVEQIEKLLDAERP